MRSRLSVRKVIDLGSVEFASFPQRVLARFLDIIFVSLLFAIFMSIAGFELDKNAGLTGDIGLGLWVWFLPILYLAYELPGTASRGQTLGKRIMGILIVRTDGQTGVSAFIPFVGILALGWFVFDPQRQNLPDKVSRTFVVRVPESFFSRETQPDSSEINDQ